MQRDPRLEMIIHNEEKWREHQFKVMDDISKRVRNLEVTAATLKVKIGLISGFFGALSSALVSLVLNKPH